MTHDRIYENVQNHRDIWGQHFHTVRRGDESTEFVRHYSNDAPEPEYVEMELLGLGVAWLVENRGVPALCVAGNKRYIASAMITELNSTTCNSNSILEAVYAAIGEVKGKGKA